MKNKRKRTRQAAEARLVLNDWEPHGVRTLYHPEHGTVEVSSGGKVGHYPRIKCGFYETVALPLRRGDDFWLAANYVFKKGWA